MTWGFVLSSSVGIGSLSETSGLWFVDRLTVRAVGPEAVQWLGAPALGGRDVEALPNWS